MNNRDRILKFLAEELSPGEREEFSKELNSSKELQDEFDNVKNSLKKMNYDTQIELNETYFENLVPGIRNRIDVASDPRFKFTLRRGLALAFVTLILAVLIIRTVDSGNFKSGTGLASAEELSSIEDSILNSYLYDSDYSDLEEYPESGLADISELNLQDVDLELYLIGNSSIINLSAADVLPDEDMENVIMEISKKKIL